MSNPCPPYNLDLGGSYTMPGGQGGNGAGSNGGVLNSAQSGSTGGQMGTGGMLPCDFNCVTGVYADRGASGGTWGTAGQNGIDANNPHSTYNTTNWQPDGYGGGAGYAIISNGHTITWLGGNSSPNVLGSII